MQQLAAGRRAARKQLAHEEAAEQRDLLVARHQEAEALDLARDPRGIDPHRDADDRRVGDSGERVRQLGVGAAQESRRLGGAGRDHDPRRAHLALAARARDRHPPERAVARQTDHARPQRGRVVQPLREAACEGPEPLRRRVACRRGRARAGGASAVAEQADRDGSEAALELDQPAQHGLGAEFVFVARVDAGEKGSDQPRDRLVSEAPAGEGRHGFAGGVAAEAQRLREQAQLAARREQTRAREADRRERNRQQLAVANHEPQPARGLRGLQRVAQAERARAGAAAAP